MYPTRRTPYIDYITFVFFNRQQERIYIYIYKDLSTAAKYVQSMQMALNDRQDEYRGKEQKKNPLCQLHT